MHRAQTVSEGVREDVVRVARSREPGQTLKQFAADLGIAESCLRNWLKAADVEDGVSPGPRRPSTRSCGRPAVGSDCWSGRTRCCGAPRPTCLEPSCRERLYPLVKEFAADGVPVVVTCRVLKLARRWSALRGRR